VISCRFIPISRFSAVNIGPLIYLYLAPFVGVFAAIYAGLYVFEVNNGQAVPSDFYREEETIRQFSSRPIAFG
jgi:hypothetical protein